MKNPKWLVLLGIAGLLASAPAAFAAETGKPEAAKFAARVPSAPPAPAAASVRPTPPKAMLGMIGECPSAPAERMAESIAEFYASGKMRLN